LSATAELTAQKPGASADAPDVKRGLKAALAYTVASGLSNVLSFLLLPLMTRIVSPAQYGQLSIALAIGGVMGIALSLGLDVSALRNYYQLADDPRRRESHIGLLWLVLLIAPLTVVTILSAAIAPLLTNSSVLPPVNFVLALFGGALFAAATTIPFAVLRAAQRLRAFLIIGIGNAVLSSAGAVIAVIVLRTGVTGWLTSVVVANLGTLILATIAVPFRRPRQPDWGLLRQAFKLGLPMIPHYVSHYGLQLADRFVLAIIVSTTSLGVYSLASNLSTPVMILVFSLGQGFYPSYSQAGTEHGTGDLPAVIVTQVTGVALITLSGALLAAPVVDLMTPTDYHAAGSLAVWLVVGYGFLGLYGIPIAIASLTLGTTRGIWHTTLTSLVINLAMVRFLVPIYGLTAAAVASAVAYAVLFAGVSVYAYRRGARVAIPVRRLTGIVSLCLAAYALAATFIGSQTVADAVLRCVAIGLTAAVLALSLPEVRARIVGAAGSVRSLVL
jgi:O-antigen/teichoic acid export membrane protein